MDLKSKLTQEVWNNFIAIPHNKNKEHKLSVAELRKIINKCIEDYDTKRIQN